MRNLILLASVFLVSCGSRMNFYDGADPKFQYTGRIEFADKSKPRFWQPGVYVNAKFDGTSCEILVNDEVLWGKSHNYLSVVVDNGKSIRIQTKQANDTIRITDLAPGEHSLTIAKDTEAGIGYVEFVGIRCDELLVPDPKPERKIEFFGNSITCGNGMDYSENPCSKGEWYDQHNAYESYGPLTARALDAQWQLSSVSGIGLANSCCQLEVVMPEVYDKINMRDKKLDWDFSKYQPDVVTVCLGQNDGIQDSVDWSASYVNFIKTLRSKYPNAQIVCLTSPMADENLRNGLANYLTGIVNYLNKNGDQKVSKYFYSRSWNSGCDGHPDGNEHKVIAAELTAYLKETMKW